MKIAQEPDVVVQVCYIRVTSVAALCKYQRSRESNALIQGWFQSMFSCELRIRLGKPFLSIPDILKQLAKCRNRIGNFG